MKKLLFEQIQELEGERHHPVIVCASSLQTEILPVLYACLQAQKRAPQLDLVLMTEGGAINAARRIALLLREYAEGLNILIPYKARSAGTLLALNADQLVMGPMAELGPLDPHIAAETAVPMGTPGKISAEEVRVFRLMAQEWFDVQDKENGIQLLSLLTQRIFPTTLSSFYRSEQSMRQIAYELLAFRSSDGEKEKHQHLVEQLINGYYAHDYAITRREAQHLGLQVSFPSHREEILLWKLYETWDHATDISLPQEEQAQAVMASSLFFARHVLQWLPVATDAQTQTPKVKRSRWSIEGW